MKSFRNSSTNAAFQIENFSSKYQLKLINSVLVILTNTHTNRITQLNDFTAYISININK